MRCPAVLAIAIVAHGASAQAAQQEEYAGPALLSRQRMDALSPADKSAWRTYVVRSRELHSRDSLKIAREIKATGVSAMQRAPYAAPDFRFGEREQAWFRSDSAMRLANSILTWQTPSGGWSKRTDMWKTRTAGTSFYSETETWHYAPTFDNGATTGQLRFLAEMVNATGLPAYARAFERGLDLVLAAQQPNGCWPQTYPLDGGYHDAVTFNDDVTVLVLRLLDDAAQGKWEFVPPRQRSAAKAAAKRGVSCIVKSQVAARGERTVWGQQHDPLTLESVPARRYELAGLAGRESASIMLYLMSLTSPSASVRDAVDAAAHWFESHSIRGYRYEGYSLTSDSTAPRLWPRLTETATDKPIFANRDGVRLYDWNKLTDRRTGYGWFGTEPAQALAQYRIWSSRNHRSIQ